jgi:hypothetical protein
MRSHGKSIVAGIVVVGAALASFALIAACSSRALTQTGAAEAQAAQAREAEAKAREAAAAKAKDQAIRAQAAQETKAKAEAQAAQARAAAPVKGAESMSLDLSKFLQMRADSFANSTRFPWPAVPRGSQTFVGVPVEIQGATMLWGQRNADAGLKYPEAITGIPCQQTFMALYILHGTFYEGAQGEPSFEVVLNYQGGEKQTEAILCGDDSRNWYVKEGEKMLGPSAKRSALAWTGTGKAAGRDQAIRFCMTAIENKYPDRQVATIDLVSSKKQTAGCILAITVGKAGLLKPPPDEPADRSQPNDSKTARP